MKKVVYILFYVFCDFSDTHYYVGMRGEFGRLGWGGEILKWLMWWTPPWCDLCLSVGPNIIRSEGSGIGHWASAPIEATCVPSKLAKRNSMLDFYEVDIYAESKLLPLSVALGEPSKQKALVLTACLSMTPYYKNL